MKGPAQGFGDIYIYICRDDHVSIVSQFYIYRFRFLIAMLCCVSRTKRKRAKVLGASITTIFLTEAGKTL
jgi:hypothetical protein